jgi:TetR/AcrR family transcriptional repressor of mexJK operon
LASQTDPMTKAPKRAVAAAPIRQRDYPRKTEIVLAAAERVFLERGYGGTSMDEVAERAGVSKRTIYSNFGSKQDLFAAVIATHCAEVLPDALVGVDLETTNPEPVLCMLATKFLTSIFSKVQVQLYQTVVAASRQFPEIGKMMFEGPIMDSQNIFDRFLRVQAGLGHLRFPDIDNAAPQLIALLKTNQHMRLLFHQPTATSKRAIAQSAEASVHLFLHGAMPRSNGSGGKGNGATARAAVKPAASAGKNRKG